MKLNNQKGNKRFIILFFLLFLSVIIPLPYYIEKDGGIIDTSGRIEVENAYPTSGKFYMTYVSEMKVNLPIYIISFFEKNWDLIKKEQVVLNNETEEESNFRSKLLLEESTQNAILAATTLAHLSPIIQSEECYVTYVDPIAQTDLKIKDKIKKIEGVEVTNKKQISSILNKYKENDTIEIEVENENKIYHRTARLMKINQKITIGIMITVKRNMSTNPKIDIRFEKGESGSSGGLMMALNIYNALVEEDITGGKKIAGTGTIDENGNVGEISGIVHKIRGAENNADIFLAPSGENYEEALRVVKDEKLNIQLIEVSTLEEAIQKIKEGN